MEIEATNARGEPDGTWTFITNHAGALLLICQNPDIRLADLAEQLEITERAAQRIVHDLVDGGYLSVVKRGRRNHYEVTCETTMRHPSVRSVNLRRLLDIVDPVEPRQPHIGCDDENPPAGASPAGGGATP